MAAWMVSCWGKNDTLSWKCFHFTFSALYSNFLKHVPMWNAKLKLVSLKSAFLHAYLDHMAEIQSSDQLPHRKRHWELNCLNKEWPIGWWRSPPWATVGADTRGILPWHAILRSVSSSWALLNGVMLREAGATTVITWCYYAPCRYSTSLASTLIVPWVQQTSPSTFPVGGSFLMASWCILSRWYSPALSLELWNRMLDTYLTLTCS